jgi:hypothetical protein
VYQAQTPEWKEGTPSRAGLGRCWLGHRPER